MFKAKHTLWIRKHIFTSKHRTEMYVRTYIDTNGSYLSTVMASK